MEKVKTPSKEVKEQDAEDAETVDLSNYDPAEGPPNIPETDGSVVPIDFSQPAVGEALVDAKKAKELKKKLEKEAKLKKFQAKQKQQKPAGKPAEGEAKPKAKPVKDNKDKSLEVKELLEEFKKLQVGSKKPTDGKLPD